MSTKPSSSARPTNSPPLSSPTSDDWRTVTNLLQRLAGQQPVAALVFVKGAAKALESLIADGDFYPF